MTFAMLASRREPWWKRAGGRGEDAARRCVRPVPRAAGDPAMASSSHESATPRTPESEMAEINNIQQSPPSRGSGAVWAIVVVVLLFLLAWFFFFRGGRSSGSGGSAGGDAPAAGAPAGGSGGAAAGGGASAG